MPTPRFRKVKDAKVNEPCEFISLWQRGVSFPKEFFSHFKYLNICPSKFFRAIVYPRLIVGTRCDLISNDRGDLFDDPIARGSCLVDSKIGFILDDDLEQFTFDKCFNLMKTFRLVLPFSSFSFVNDLGNPKNVSIEVERASEVFSSLNIGL